MLQKLEIGAPLISRSQGSKYWFTLLEAVVNVGDRLEVRGPDGLWLDGHFHWSGRRGINPSLALTPDLDGLGSLRIILDSTALCRFSQRPER
jgi:hypothetical protein